MEVINAFAKELLNGMMVTVRRPRGREVMAACGQLQSKVTAEKLALQMQQQREKVANVA